MIKLRKNSAFTMPEILLAIVTVGVVAALTIPTVMQTTENKAKVSMVKKNYAVIEKAINLAETKYGNYDTWIGTSDEDSVSKTVANRLVPYLPVDTDCGYENDGKCFPKVINDMNDTTSSINYVDSESARKLKLINGTGLVIKTDSDGTYFVMDVGKRTKKTKKWGKDIFVFTYDKNPNGNGYHLNKGHGDNALASGDTPCIDDYDCTEWVYKNENLDYLNTKDGKTCSNGKVLGFDVQSSCKKK